MLYYTIILLYILLYTIILLLLLYIILYSYLLLFSPIPSQSISSHLPLPFPDNHSLSSSLLFSPSLQFYSSPFFPSSVSSPLPIISSSLPSYLSIIIHLSHFILYVSAFSYSYLYSINIPSQISDPACFIGVDG